MKKSTKIMAAVLGLLTLVVLILLVVTQPKPSPAPSPVPSPITQKLNQIAPGTTSKEDVFAKLGQPLTSKESNGSTILTYPSYNQYNPDEVTVTNGQVAFIRERLYDDPDTSLKSRLDKLGQNYVELYGPDTNSGVSLFTYPDQGVALLANSINDTVYEVWHFPAASLETILTLPKFANYSTQEYYSQDL